MAKGPAGCETAGSRHPQMSRAFFDTFIENVSDTMNFALSETSNMFWDLIGEK